MAKTLKHCGLLRAINRINIVQHEERKVADGGVLLYIFYAQTRLEGKILFYYTPLSTGAWRHFHFIREKATGRQVI